ncbi:MAG: ribosome-recycling factor [Patescibacteria group bacterium]
MIDESWLNSGRQKMDTVMQLVKGEMVNIQTGRAKPAMVEDVKVEAYEGTWLTLKEVAGITAPDPSTLLIKPWDSSILEKIVKGIQQSDLHVNPIADNDQIRITIPSLNQERREELVKIVKQKIEAGKAMLRQTRVELKKDIDNQKDQAGVSEDDITRQHDKLQKLIDEYNQKMDQIEQQKQKELITI